MEFPWTWIPWQSNDPVNKVSAGSGQYFNLSLGYISFTYKLSELPTEGKVVNYIDLRAGTYGNESIMHVNFDGKKELIYVGDKMLIDKADATLDEKKVKLWRQIAKDDNKKFEICYKITGEEF